MPSQRPFEPLRVAVVTVSDTRTPQTDTSGDTIAQRLEAAGHEVASREIVTDDAAGISERFGALVSDPSVDVVLATGGTGFAPRDVTPQALAPWVTRPIPGFGELFRMLSYEEIGTSTMQSRAEGAQCGDTFVFLLPGSTGAVRTAMDRILIEQLDVRHRPCNFAELVPRLRR
ncbi:MAG: molybdenum cofactor biosynthesis protein B [Myxococcota bacterium]